MRTLTLKILRPFGFVLILVATLCSCTSEPEHPKDEIEGLADLFQHMGRMRVVRVVGQAGTPKQVAGKGVAVGDGSWILTGSHLVKDANAVNVSDVDGHSEEARVVSNDERRGLALLRLTDMRVEPARLELDSIPVSGENIYLMVDDEHVGFSSAAGYVAGRREVPAGDLLRLSAFVSPAEYGGPVFGFNGKLVGLVIPDALVDRDVRASYAQPVTALLDFLKAAGGPQR